MTREFRLSPAGSGRGVSCDANGAFIGSVPLLKRVRVRDQDVWAPRDCEELSEAASSDYGLPMNLSSRMGGLHAISRALNEGDIARAQVATVLLAIPELPALSGGTVSRNGLVKYIRDLHQSDLIKADWDSDEHPRWPAGTSDSQGGQFAPKGEGDPGEFETAGYGAGSEEGRNQSPLVPAAAYSREDISRNPPRRKSEEECDAQLASDMYVCGSLRDKREAAVCRASAMQRYGNCLAGKPLPPLTLPDPEYDFHPLPTTPPSYGFPSRPPWWTPFLFVPWWWWLLAPAAA